MEIKCGRQNAAPVLFLLVFLLFSAVGYTQTIVIDDGSVWSDQPHTVMRYISLSAGGTFIYNPPTGYSRFESVDDSLWMYGVSLSASKSVPLISRVSWTSTATFTPYEETVRLERNDSAKYAGFAELRLPFVTSVLSYNTSWYLQYAQSAERFGATFSDDVHFGDGSSVLRGEGVTIGSNSRFFALAIDTPVTEGNSPYSYSRFGGYYQTVERLRSISNTGFDGILLLDVEERHGGFFYDIKKPVFFEGFIMRVYFSAGYGVREIQENVYGLVSSDFDDYQLLLYVNAKLSAAYRYEFAGNFGIIFGFGYDYGAIISLKSISSGSAQASNSDTHIWNGNLALDFIW